MKNTELQKNLDKKKYLQSEIVKTDLSGRMDYCGFCQFKDSRRCILDQSEREQNTVCAKSYNRMVRRSER